MNANEKMSGTDPELQRLRDSIDNIDAALIHMLAERFRITKEVGAYKARMTMAPADPQREEQQIRIVRCPRQVCVNASSRALDVVIAQVEHGQPSQGVD